MGTPIRKYKIYLHALKWLQKIPVSMGGWFLSRMGRRWLRSSLYRGIIDIVAGMSLAPKKECVMKQIAALLVLLPLLGTPVYSAQAGSYAPQAHNGGLCPDSRGHMRPCPWSQWGGNSRRGGGYGYYQPSPPRVIYAPPRLLGHNVCDPYGRCWFVPAR
jgi:hypothetical protein